MFGFERPACVVFCLVSGFMFDVLSSRRPLSSWARAAVALVVSVLSHLRMAQGLVMEYTTSGCWFKPLHAYARTRAHTHARSNMHLYGSASLKGCRRGVGHLLRQLAHAATPTGMRRQ